MGQRMAILCQVGMVETNYLMQLMYFGLNLFNVILHNCQRWATFNYILHENIASFTANLHENMS